MIMTAEVRRNAGLREIERHRDSFGAALRQASDDVVEAEFIETSPVQGMQQMPHDQPAETARSPRQCPQRHGPKTPAGRAKTGQKCAPTWPGNSRHGGPSQRTARRGPTLQPSTATSAALFRATSLPFNYLMRSESRASPAPKHRTNVRNKIAFLRCSK